MKKIILTMLIVVQIISIFSSCNNNSANVNSVNTDSNINTSAELSPKATKPNILDDNYYNVPEERLLTVEQMIRSDFFGTDFDSSKEYYIGQRIPSYIKFNNEIFPYENSHQYAIYSGNDMVGIFSYPPEDHPINGGVSTGYAPELNRLLSSKDDYFLTIYDQDIFRRYVYVNGELHIIEKFEQESFNQELDSDFVNLTDDELKAELDKLDFIRNTPNIRLDPTHTLPDS